MKTFLFSNKNFKILLKYCHSAKTLTSGDVTENIHSLFWAKKTGPRLSLFLWVEIWYQVKAFNQKKIAASPFLKSLLESCFPTFQHKEKNFSNQMHQNQKQWWWWWLWWRVKRQILSWFFAIQRKAEWRGGGEATNTKTTSKFFKPWFYTIANTNRNTETRSKC